MKRRKRNTLRQDKVRKAPDGKIGMNKRQVMAAIRIHKWKKLFGKYLPTPIGERLIRLGMGGLPKD